MPAAKVDANAVRRELEEVLKSPGFARNERLSSFLRFVVEEHVAGREHELKESVIASEVFGRSADYSPKKDPIVRTEARRLRERLRRYYDGAGADDTLRIELPSGGYVPLIRNLGLTDPSASGPDRRPTGFGARRWVTLAGVGMAAVSAAVGVMTLVPTGGLRPDTRSAAYDLYIRARAFELLPNVSGVESSIDLFRQAIAKDDSFGPAYAGLAAGYAARSAFDGFGEAEVADMLAKGWAAAKKAMELDARLADAYDGLAMMQARQAQWAPAERSFRRAIELAPRDVLWRDHFAMFHLLPLGRIEDAIRELRIAEEIDPLLPQTHSLLRTALRSAGRFDEAFSHCQKGAQNDQQRSSCWAENLQRQGKNDDAVRILEAVWSGHLMEPGAQALGVAYAKAGRAKDAERLAAMLPRLASKAQVFGALGDKDRTFGLLNEMVLMGPARIGRDFLISPNFAFLRGDPRLNTLRKATGLPE